MELQKAYDRVDIDALWKMLRICRINGKLLISVTSFYQERKTSVQVESVEGVVPS